VEPIAVLEAAVAQTRPIVAGITPDQYDLPTPCTEWDVRALLDHLLGAVTMWLDLPAGAADTSVLAQEHAGDDPVRSYDAITATTLAAWRADGVVDNPVQFPGGMEMPGAFAARMLAGDVLVHGWDLAQATGQSAVWDQELADDILGWQEEAARRFPPEMRGHAFAPEVEAPADADAMTRLLCVAGRQPS
jgi:uncharacterized protein (TIGR03086 family)